MKEDVLVSLEERKYLAKNCVKEMGKEVILNVLDVQKAVARMRDQRLKLGLAPYVVIKPIIENKYKEMRLQGTYQRDLETGLFYGIPTREDSYGNVIWRKIRIVEKETLRIMDNLDDARTWTVLRFHPKLKNSPFQQSDPVFEVHDPVKAARTDVAKATSMKKAFEAINKLEEKPVDMLNFVRFMGEEITSYTTIGILEGMLNSLAMQDPIGFLKNFNDPSRSYAQLFHAAYQVGLFNELPGQGYYFNNTPLGLELVDVIATMKRDQVITTAIIAGIEENDEALKSIHAEASKSPKK